VSQYEKTDFFEKGGGGQVGGLPGSGLSMDKEMLPKDLER
jgi:hypothetical protein